MNNGQQTIEAIKKTLAEAQSMLKLYELERQEDEKDKTQAGEVKLTFTGPATKPVDFMPSFRLVTEEQLSLAWDRTFGGSSINYAAHSAYFRALKEQLGFGVRQ